MSQTETRVGLADYREDTPPYDRGDSGPDVNSADHRSQVGRTIAAALVCLLAVVLFAGGAWALWQDRVARDGSGFVSIGTTDLRTETYAIVGRLQGDGPRWLWGRAVMGKERVRATTQSGQPLFIGIARTSEVDRYLRGAGYATIERFEVTRSSTHPGGPPSSPPTGAAIWAASIQGTGRQTLVWTPRQGDWSIVLMNADAQAGVAVHGNGSAKFPMLPWVAIALLVAAAVSGLFGASLMIRAVNVTPPATPVAES